MHIDVALTPESLSPKKLEGRQVVIIDTLRATTTIVNALANGARAVVPVTEPSQAVEIRDKLGADNVLLGGEREGLRIENFDLGNSPEEYSEEVVSGKTIALCTTNGSRLFTQFRYSGSVWVGSFLNLLAVVDGSGAEGSDLTIICAGHEGDFSMEDTLCAGGFIDALSDRFTVDINMNDSAKLALLHYNANRGRLLEAMSDGEHGRRLSALGFDKDIAFAADRDKFDIAPRFVDGKIVAVLEKQLEDQQENQPEERTENTENISDSKEETN